MAKKKEMDADAEMEADANKAEGEEGADGEMAPKKGKKKLVFIAGGALLVVLIVVGLLVSGVLGGGKKEAEHEAEQAENAAPVDNKPVYYELPQFLVNLNSTTGRASFLKMSVTLQLKDQAAVLVMDANKPRVLDAFNTYLRELRPSDVQGSAGIYRLRDELMTRLNGMIEEGLVKDILFSEIIVQ